MTGCWAVLLAAGRGERTGLQFNKVFFRLRGRSLLSRCLDVFANVRLFDGVVIALADGDRDAFAALLREEGVPALPYVVAQGGKTRTLSARAALALVPETARVVAIHDAARAFVPESVVRATVESAMRYGSGVASTQVVDTIKRVDEQGLAVETPPRDRLRAVQTPQAFSRDIIMRAHACAEQEGFEATDDAALVEKYIGPVRLVETEDGRRNVKITMPEDIVSREAPRTGTGYDAHRLVEDRDLVLGGVHIPYEKGLLGHSDADVLVHALIDALLGAAALGDIGALFPDSDPQYKGISSITLLSRTRNTLSRHGFDIVNVDATLIAQRPKIAPHIAQMRQNIASALAIGTDRVSVKATTTEGMGFTGTGEGMAATAIATVMPRI